MSEPTGNPSPPTPSEVIRLGVWMVGVLGIFGCTLPGIGIWLTVALIPDDEPGIERMESGATVYRLDSLHRLVVLPISIGFVLTGAVVGASLWNRRLTAERERLQLGPDPRNTLFRWIFGSIVMLLLLFFILIAAVLPPLLSIRTVTVEKQEFRIESVLFTRSIDRRDIRMEVEREEVQRRLEKQERVRLMIEDRTGRRFHTYDRYFAPADLERIRFLEMLNELQGQVRR